VSANEIAAESVPVVAGPRRWTRRLNIAFLVIATVASGLFVWRVGRAPFADTLAGVGWGLALSSALHGVSLLFDAATLRCCAGAAWRAIPYRTVLRAGVAGHAVNEVTPMVRIGEVTKLAVLSERLDGRRAGAALIVQNLLMFGVNCGLIALAPLVALAARDVDRGAAAIFVAVAAVFAVLGVGTVILIGRGPTELPFRIARRLGMSAARVQRWRAGWHGVEDLWLEVARDRPRMRRAWALQIAGKSASVAEIGVILWCLGAPLGTIAVVAPLVQGALQVVIWATLFVPLQAGTTEGGAWLLYGAIGMPPYMGVLVELARKARKLVFIAIGVAVLGWNALRRTP
jgi:lysylphosphatidylglycerol synthase-like protein